MSWFSKWFGNRRSMTEDAFSVLPLTTQIDDEETQIDDVSYELTNKLANFLNEDPRDGEPWSEFLIRHTGGADEKSVNDFISSKVSEKYGVGNVRERVAERQRVTAELLAGRDPKPDRSLLSSRDMATIKLKIYDDLVKLEVDQVKEKLLSGQEVKWDELSMTAETLKQTLQEVTIELKARHLEEIRYQLEKGHQPVFDNKLVSADEVAEIAEEVNTANYQWQLNRQRPNPQPYGVSNYGAESLVADWLTYLGLKNVTVTVASGDGGIDVETDTHVCQVKNYSSQGVSVQEVRELFGVAVSMGKAPLIFTSSSLTAPAYAFAEANDIAAIQYDAAEAALFALNELGANLLVSGKYQN